MSRLYNILNTLVNKTKVETMNVATNVDAYRVGSVVTVTFRGVQNTSTTERATVGTLPAGWRPSNLVLCANGNGSGYADVDGVTGRVQVFASTKQSIFAAVTYVATN